MVGIEPTTFSLRVRCSTIEPHQRIQLFESGLVATNQLLYRLSYTSKTIYKHGYYTIPDSECQVGLLPQQQSVNLTNLHDKNFLKILSS